MIESAVARRGRPRDSAVDRRVLSAAWDLLNARGYAGLNVDEVAERAAVAKTTLYRRGPTQSPPAPPPRRASRPRLRRAPRGGGARRSHHTEGAKEMTVPEIMAAPPPRRGRVRRRRRVLLAALAAILVIVAGYAVWTNIRPYTLQASIQIASTPQRVWAVLTDLPAYPRWNPFIISASGRVQVGATLTNRMHDATGNTTVTPTVLVVEPGRELRWVGRVGPGGI